MKIKVCGISKKIELETCLSNDVDYCGFILNYPKSHRYINFDQAQNLININKKKSKYVGVLVNPNIKELENFSKLDLDYFQLYGNYNSKNLIQIKEKYKKKIIACIQVENKKDILNYKKIESGSDIILWDSSGYEKSLSWDYSWIKSISTNVQKMIAGNITSNKIKDLIGLADIIDVSGALETNKVKDIDKIEKFIYEFNRVKYEN